MSSIPFVSPLTTLIGAAQELRTGEFVVAVGAREVHVFLRAGAVAWATDSGDRAFFSRTIKELCSIDDATFSEVVQECRKSHLPLGETLVSLGLATQAQVHEVLRAQSQRVLQALARLDDATFMFLERPGYLTYSKELTFDLSELLEASAATPTSQPTPAPRDRSSSQSMLERLSSLPGHEWTVDCSREETFAERGVTPSGICSVASGLEEQHVSFVALRGHDFTLVGSLIEPGRWVWTRIASPAVLAKIVSFMWRAPQGTTPWANAPAQWRSGPKDSGLWPIMDQAFQLAPPIAALEVVVDAQRCAAGRHGLVNEDAGASWQRARDLLKHLRVGSPDSVGIAVGPEQVMMALDGQVILGANDELKPGHETSVLALADGGCPIGLGLAALSLVFRHAAHERRH